MTPAAKLRMEVYQEGQRAYGAGTECPYTDWRAKTWAKGYTAAKEWHADVRAEYRVPPQEIRSAGWTIRRRVFSSSISVESPDGDGTDVSRDSSDLYHYFDALLKESGL